MSQGSKARRRRSSKAKPDPISETETSSEESVCSRPCPPPVPYPEYSTDPIMRSGWTRKPSTADKTESLIRQWTSERESEMRAVIADADSPIESAFRAAMMAEGWRTETSREQDGRVTRCAFDRLYDRVGSLIYRDGHTSFGGGTLLVNDGLFDAISINHLDLCVGDRRVVVDIFMLVHMPPVFNTALAIELDGHDFHERTKEQAQRDKSRDRILQELGWKAIRFTGSEVYADPIACVREAERILTADGNSELWNRDPVNPKNKQRVRVAQ